MSETQLAGGGRSRWLAPIVLVAVLGAVYVLTLLPGPGYSGDTSKFQFVGKMLGTPHETGYPTYLLLAHIFTAIFPFGSTAYQVNLLSAIFSVIASLVLYRTLLLFGFGRWIALVTTLCFGLGYTVWLHSVIAEVYALNLVFVALVIFYFVRWHFQRREIDFYLACLFYAFSFGNHLTMITILPAIVYLVWITHRRAFLEPKRIGLVLLIIVAGALQYAYVFWRFYAPETTYLEMAVPDLKTFIWYVTGGRFQWRLFAYPFAWVFYTRVPLFAWYYLREELVLLPAALYGIVAMPWSQVRLFLLIALAGNTLFSLVYAIPDIFVYLLPSYFIMAIFAAQGLVRLLEFLQRRKLALHPAWLMVLPLVFATANYGGAHEQDDTKHAREVHAVLEQVGHDALIVCPDYHYAMIFWYDVFCEGWDRKNIHIVFYHDDPFPARALGTYLQEEKPFIVKVRRTAVPVGLRVFFFAKRFEEEQSRLTAKERGLRAGARAFHKQDVNLDLRLLADAGVTARQVGDEFFELVTSAADSTRNVPTTNKGK